ncbi:unnamed protein product [Penicillium salamii]|nr:unnamed protein product [Penicillium salamii]
MQHTAWEQKMSPQNRQILGSVISFLVVGQRRRFASSIRLSKFFGNPTSSKIAGWDRLGQSLWSSKRIPEREAFQWKIHPEITASKGLLLLRAGLTDMRISSMDGSWRALVRRSSSGDSTSKPVFGNSTPCWT